jgi:hypothetical protein
VSSEEKKGVQEAQVNIRSRRLFVFLLLALLGTLAGVKVYAEGDPVMKCTHYSDGCIKCKILNENGDVIGKIAVDCR